MSWLSLQQVCAMTGGTQDGGDAMIDSVAIDSRTLNSGSLFVALKGERFDGHAYVGKAAQAGAAAAMVARKVPVSLPQLIVGDTLQALSQFAAAWRRKLGIFVLGLTGSNGKTTTKEMIASILQHCRRTAVTAGNLNNHIGVPLTLLKMRAEHELAVVEMGANHPGEISRLCAIARPDAGLVLNAAPAHIEGFGNLDGVARAKGELFASLPKSGAGIINRDDAFYDYWCRVLGARRRVSFGLSEDADFHAVSIAGPLQLSLNGVSVRCQLSLPGRHNIANALAAAAAASIAGAGADSIVAGLEGMQPVAGRLAGSSGVGGLQLIDDSYNANPGSLQAALAVLQQRPGRRWLALGDMGELGAETRALHAAAGLAAKAAGVERLFTVGSDTRAAAEHFGSGARHFASIREAATYIAAHSAPDVSLLVKGSRAAGMEQLVAALTPGTQEGGAAC